MLLRELVVETPLGSLFNHCYVLQANLDLMVELVVVSRFWYKFGLLILRIIHHFQKEEKKEKVLA